MAKEPTIEEFAAMLGPPGAAASTPSAGLVGPSGAPISKKPFDPKEYVKDKSPAQLEQIIKTPFSKEMEQAARYAAGERPDRQNPAYAHAPQSPTAQPETIPAPDDLLLPETPFNPSAGFKPTAGRMTGIPLEDGPEQTISSIDDAITGKGGKGSRAASSRAPRAPTIKAPPVIGANGMTGPQVPPPPPEEPEENAASGAAAGAEGAEGVGAMIGLGGLGLITAAYATAHERQGSVSDFMPGSNRGHAEESSAQSIVAALTRMSGIRSRF